MEYDFPIIFGANDLEPHDATETEFFPFVCLSMQVETHFVIVSIDGSRRGIETCNTEVAPDGTSMRHHGNHQLEP
jgi:hypothetical protein